MAASEMVYKLANPKLVFYVLKYESKIQKKNGQTYFELKTTPKY
jgi:hypothetical protein